MSERDGQPLHRMSAATVTKILRSKAFLHSRER